MHTPHRGDPSAAAVVQDLFAKGSRIRTLTGTLTEQFSYRTGPRKARTVRIWISPEARRKEEGPLPGASAQASVSEAAGQAGPASQPSEIEIELATCSWHVAGKEIRQTCWGHTVHFIPSPIPDSQSRKALDEAFYLGRENLGSIACHVFDTPQFSWWYGVEDGLLRQKIQKPRKSDPTGMTFAQIFADLQFDPPLDPGLFSVVPPEGAWVTEVHPQREGPGAETSRMVPYVLPKGSSEQQTLTSRKIAEARAAFALVTNFSCQYKFFETRHGEKVGPPPGTSTTSVTPDDDDATYWTTPETRQEGTLTWATPDRLAYRFDETSNIYPPKTGQFLLSDGVTRWMTQPLGYPAASQPVPVVQENLARKRQFQREMTTLTEKYQAIGRRFREPGRPERVFPPSVLQAREMPYGARLPDFLFDPFRGLATAALLFKGEERSDETETLEFEALENEHNRRMVFWIGRRDGIPRRIEEFDWTGSHLETTIVLSQVATDQPIASATFTLIPDPRYQIVDLDADGGLGHAMAREALDMPPERTFAAFFATPTAEVTELQGSGMGFMGGEFFIRFRCPGKVTLKDEAGFAPTDVREAAAYFAKLFPEDEPLLGSPETLSARGFEKRNDDGDQSGAVLLVNPREKVYFFRYWYAH